MANDAIGEVHVTISGDYSKLNADINEAQQIAGSGAQKIAQAFTAASPSVDAVTGAIEKLAQQSKLAGGDLAIFRTVMEGDARAGVSLSDSLRTLAASAGSVGKPVADAAAAILQEQQAATGATAANQALATSNSALAASAAPVNAAVQSVATSAQSMQNHVQSAGQGLSAAGRLMTAAMAPVVAAFAVSIKSATDFELEMRKVTSLMSDSTEADFTRLSEQALQLSRTLGVDAVGAAKALYEAISAGVPKENAISFLEVASVAAIAGVTKTKVAVDGLTTVINAYHLDASKAKEISDAMFMAVNLGKFTFEQLSASMGKTSGFAAQLGVSFQEVLGAAASISKQGFTVSEAMTQIQSAMKAIIAPNKEMNALLAQTGYESGQAMLKALGFEGSLEKLREAVGGNETALAKAFGRIEGFKGLLALTGDGAVAAARDLGAMQHASDGLGAATLAYNEINKSAARQFEMLKADIRATAIELGTALLPTVREAISATKPFVDDLKSLAKAFAQLPEETRSTVIGITAVAAAIGPLLIIAGKLATSISALTGLIGGSGAGLIGVLGGLALAAEAVHFWEVTEEVQKFAEAVKVTVGVVQEELKKLEKEFPEVAAAARMLGEGAAAAARVIDATLKPALNTIVTALNATLAPFRMVLDEMKLFSAAVEFLTGKYPSMEAAIKQANKEFEAGTRLNSEYVRTLYDTAKAHDATTDAQKRGTDSANVLHPAMDKVSKAAAGIKTPAHEAAVELGNIVNAMNGMAEPFKTVLGSFEEQAKGFLDFVRTAKPVEQAIEVITGGVKAMNPEFAALAKELGRFPTIGEQVAAGLKVIYGGTNQAGTGFVQLKDTAKESMDGVAAAAESGANSTVASMHRIVAAVGDAIDGFGRLSSSHIGTALFQEGGGFNAGTFQMLDPQHPERGGYSMRLGPTKYAQGGPQIIMDWHEPFDLGTSAPGRNMNKAFDSDWRNPGASAGAPIATSPSAPAATDPIIAVAEAIKALADKLGIDYLDAAKIYYDQQLKDNKEIIDTSRMTWGEVNKLISTLQAQGLSYEEAVAKLGGTVTRSGDAVGGAVERSALKGFGGVIGELTKANTTLTEISSPQTSVKSFGLIAPGLDKVERSASAAAAALQDFSTWYVGLNEQYAQALRGLTKTFFELQAQFAAGSITLQQFRDAVSGLNAQSDVSYQQMFNNISPSSAGLRLAAPPKHFSGPTDQYGNPYDPIKAKEGARNFIITINNPQIRSQKDIDEIARQLRDLGLT